MDTFCLFSTCNCLSVCSVRNTNMAWRKKEVKIGLGIHKIQVKVSRLWGCKRVYKIASGKTMNFCIQLGYSILGQAHRVTLFFPLLKLVTYSRNRIEKKRSKVAQHTSKGFGMIRRLLISPWLFTDSRRSELAI